MWIVEFIGVVCAVVLFVSAEPIEWIKNKLHITGSLRTLLDCAMCAGFWIGICFYQDILIASIVSITAELLHRQIQKF